MSAAVSVADVRERIAAAVLDPTAPVPAGIGRRGAPSQVRRFAIYRNNVVVGLVEALARRFPVCLAIVGEAFFRAMAREFVLAMPPPSPVLLGYGDAFPGFIEGFAPADEVPYLADVARLEYARGAAHHAADALVAGAERLAELDGYPPARIRVALHPAVRLLRSKWPVVTLWEMNAGEAPLGPFANWTGEDAVVARPAYRVGVHRLPPGSFTFLTSLGSGGSLEAALIAAIAEDEAFEPASGIAALIEFGLVTAFNVTGEDHEPR